jgi:Fur family transcriptional regulator, peroxide stress response regulator
MRPATELIERCRAAGMRVTAQRRAIFGVLERNRAHPTAEDVYRAARRRARGVSLATVYNTLETLQMLGEVGRHRLDAGGDRFDPEVRPHHHFRCTGCGGVRDAFGDVETPHLAGIAGCEIECVEVVLTGQCEDCRSKTSSNVK